MWTIEKTVDVMNEQGLVKKKETRHCSSLVAWPRFSIIPTDQEPGQARKWSIEGAVAVKRCKCF